MLKAINNIRLPRKLLVAFSVIMLMVIALGGTAVVSSNIIVATGARHVTTSLPTVRALSNLLGELREYRILIYSHMTALDRDEQRELDGRVAANREALNRSVSDLSRVAGPTLAEEITTLRGLLATLEEVNARTLTASRRGQRDDTLFLVKSDAQDASRAAIAHANRMIDLATLQAKQGGVEAQATADHALTVMSVLAVLAAVVLAVIWWLAMRTITRPMTDLSAVTTALGAGQDKDVPHRDRTDELGDIAKAVEHFRLAAVARQEADQRQAQDQAVVTAALGDGLAALAKGDLSTEVKADFPPALALLKDNFNHALARLREVIGSVADSTAGIRTGSQEIAQASADLARRTEGNAASLEETSASLVQIDGRLRASAQASTQTVARADEALTTVTGGRSVAVEAVNAMERVRSSAKGIDQVIEGVDKIAFQTRILAMNAAVEAGRAGDAGRGFAVVADLVSALAMRAEEEARRARDQLTLTQTDIVTAVDAVQRVDNALQTISEGVEEVHGLLGQMASDNQAQSSAISQISVAIGTMDQSTQQNAAMVEQTSAAARNLTSAVAVLAEQAGLFTLGGGTAVVALPAPRTAAKRARPARTAERYVSPVKALPAPTKRGGALRKMEVEEEADWSDF